MLLPICVTLFCSCLSFCSIWWRGQKYIFKGLCWLSVSCCWRIVTSLGRTDDWKLKFESNILVEVPEKSVKITKHTDAIFCLVYVCINLRRCLHTQEAQSKSSISWFLSAKLCPLIVVSIMSKSWLGIKPVVHKVYSSYRHTLCIIWQSGTPWNCCLSSGGISSHICDWRGSNTTV